MNILKHFVCAFKHIFVFPKFSLRNSDITEPRHVVWGSLLPEKCQSARGSDFSGLCGIIHPFSFCIFTTTQFQITIHLIFLKSGLHVIVKLISNGVEWLTLFLQLWCHHQSADINEGSTERGQRIQSAEGIKSCTLTGNSINGLITLEPYTVLMK